MDPKTEKDIYTLNGRTELWWDVVLLVQENWCIGVGFYGSRYVLMNTWPWAGHTHNSFLEVALGTGVVGLVICTLFVGHVRAGDLADEGRAAPRYSPPTA